MAIHVSRLLLLLTACSLAWLLTAPQVLASGSGRKKASVGDSAIVGEWWTESKEGRVRFYKHRDQTFRGILTWSNKPRRDTENDDPELRRRSIIGIVLMWKLRYDDGEYEDGYVYNPEDGNVYRVDAKVLGPDELEVHGYMGISILGQSQVWTRYR